MVGLALGGTKSVPSDFLLPVTGPTLDIGHVRKKSGVYVIASGPGVNSPAQKHEEHNLSPVKGPDGCAAG